MSKTIKIKFEANQQHQLRAVENAVQLFNGLPRQDTAYTLGDDIIGNLPQDESELELSWLYDNLRTVQAAFNEYAKDQSSTSQIRNEHISLETDGGFMLEGVSRDDFASHEYPQFTFDMETGTGKTYVYLRTIHELYKHYGFRKFIIVVPSVAIYEGVVKTIDITRSHFKTLYSNTDPVLTKYDGQQITRVRGFAVSSTLEIMVMTLDAFNKSSNLFYKATEKLPGERRPFEYVQETRPILILDECQNYQSTTARAALRTLKPLFALGYSATPGSSPNTVFKLSPVDAFRLNLVKKIQVVGVTQDYNVNDPQLSLVLESVTAYGKSVKFRTLVNVKGKMVEQVVELKKGEHLADKTKNEKHKGIVISEINKRDGVVLFENGDEMVLKDDEHSLNHSRREIFRKQIENTILEHFKRQTALRSRGIKVLSLFFIDRVANYVADDGIIRQLFDEEFERLKVRDAHFKKLKAADVREGYFAKKKTKSGDEFTDTPVEEAKKNKDQKEQEKAAYELIMKNKERLLNFSEPVSFLFAHSALKEGWDNPNVFQICTLNTAQSEARKRQEIGRGLRICVNQNGDRVTDDDVNILTVVANESYASYVEGLQQEYRETGDMDYPKPTDATKAKPKRNQKVFDSKDFRQFWAKLCQCTTYHIKLDTDALVEDCKKRFNARDFRFPEPRLVITKGQFVTNTYKIELLDVDARGARIALTVSSTHDDDATSNQRYKKGALLLGADKDPNLRGFKVVEIGEEDGEPFVQFGNGRRISTFSPYSFEQIKKVETDPRTTESQQTTYPVFNLIARASKELGITRPTILEIFKGIDLEKKETIFKNPEGFSAAFIEGVREALASRIAAEIEYEVNDDTSPYDLDQLFPVEKAFQAKELIDGSQHSMYSQVQVDSEVEKRFVEWRLKKDDDDGNIACYFKFPASFKINIPKIIGNYNPDWGIVRKDEHGKFRLHLVRETKGNTDVTKLRFGNEGRKIACATKHFSAIDVDYRTVDDKIQNWWNSAENV